MRAMLSLRDGDASDVGQGSIRYSQMKPLAHWTRSENTAHVNLPRGSSVRHLFGNVRRNSCGWKPAVACSAQPMNPMISVNFADNDMESKCQVQLTFHHGAVVGPDTTWARPAVQPGLHGSWRRKRRTVLGRDAGTDEETTFNGKEMC